MPRKKLKIHEPGASWGQKGFAFIVMGFLLISTPYIIEHCGYTGEVLIANDHTLAPFDKTLIYIDQNDIGGAAGVILNKPLSEEDHAHLVSFIRDSGIPVSYGGPLELLDKILVMEEKDPVTSGGQPHFELDFWEDAVRETPDLMERIRRSIKNGERRYRVFAGYAAWGPFQLEAETLVKSAWYVVPAGHDLLFQDGSAATWEALDKAEKAQHESTANQL